MSALIEILKDTDVFAYQYRCASALYLITAMLQCQSIIIYRGISVPGNGK